MMLIAIDKRIINLELMTDAYWTEDAEFIVVLAVPQAHPANSGWRDARRIAFSGVSAEIMANYLAAKSANLS